VSYKKRRDEWQIIWANGFDDGIEDFFDTRDEAIAFHEQIGGKCLLRNRQIITTTTEWVDIEHLDSGSEPR
jgi:hypothetical protein